MNTEEIEEVLFLAMANDRLSASASALQARQKNRDRMIAILSFWLGIADKDLDGWYEDRVSDEV